MRDVQAPSSSPRIPDFTHEILAVKHAMRVTRASNYPPVTIAITIPVSHNTESGPQPPYCHPKLSLVKQFSTVPLQSFPSMWPQPRPSPQPHAHLSDHINLTSIPIWIPRIPPPKHGLPQQIMFCGCLTRNLCIVPLPDDWKHEGRGGSRVQQSVCVRILNVCRGSPQCWLVGSPSVRCPTPAPVIPASSRARVPKQWTKKSPWWGQWQGRRGRGKRWGHCQGGGRRWDGGLGRGSCHGSAQNARRRGREGSQDASWSGLRYFAKPWPHTRSPTLDKCQVPPQGGGPCCWPSSKATQRAQRCPLCVRHRRGHSGSLWYGWGRQDMSKEHGKHANTERFFSVGDNVASFVPDECSGGGGVCGVYSESP